jgi:hypothetical protein
MKEIAGRKKDPDELKTPPCESMHVLGLESSVSFSSHLYMEEEGEGEGGRNHHRKIGNILEISQHAPSIYKKQGFLFCLVLKSLLVSRKMA